MTSTAAQLSPLLIEEASKQFPDFLTEIKEKIRFFLFIHLGFGLVGGVLLLLFFSSLLITPLLKEASYLLALFFVTLFFYLIFRFYLEEKKEIAFEKIVNQFIFKAKERLEFQESIIEKHMALAALAKRAASWLQDKEYHLFGAPSFLKEHTALFEKISAYLAWGDCFALREKLLSFAIQENIKAVKRSPTSLESHILLASTLVMLSKIYAPPFLDEDKWISRARLSEKRKKRFQEIALFAVEEFKILSEFAPSDPWVRLQLAQSYHDLNMIEEETREIESLHSLRPNDPETLLNLGLLYFKQGKNASALQIYEKLKKLDSDKAEELILLYGSPL